MATEPAGILRYPYEAITETTDYLQITIFKYDTANASNEKYGKLLASTDFTNTNPFSSLKITKDNIVKAKVLQDGGVIALPMPSNIQDSNSVSYEAGNMNQLAAAGLDIAKDLISTNIFNPASIANNAQAVSDALVGKFEPIQGKPGKFKNVGDGLISGTTVDLVKKALAAQAVNVFGANVSLNSLLARSEGKILNPNMELLLNNATLRTFRFSFKMTPRDDREATSIKAIIRTFKRNMAIEEVENLFIKTPNIFELQYKKGNRPHPFLNLFQPCALTDMSVNYTGENVYATYGDGTPVSMVMTLTFKELVPVYQDDYDRKANYDGESQGALEDNVDSGDLVYGLVDGENGKVQNKNVQGVGY
mgnify:CR=1 FL=1